MKTALSLLIVCMVTICCCNTIFEVTESDEEQSVQDEVSTDVSCHHHHHHHHHHCHSQHVAFSAYLSKDMESIGKGQQIKFDKIIRNDGNGYEEPTGTFRAPISGVYSFTFVIAQIEAGKVRANLMVNGKVMVGAIAEGLLCWKDAQGTNSVNVFVAKGQSVWVEAVKGDHIEGDDKCCRYTTFSGHLLYPAKK